MHRREFLELASAVSLGAVTSGMATSNAVPAWDPSGQRERQELIYKLHRQNVGPLFDMQGNWIGKSTAPAQRERFWSCLSLLKGEETREKGNALAISSVKMHPGGGSAFENSGAMMILLKNDADLSKEARDILMDYSRRSAAKPRTVRFLGYNDNFPAMDTWIDVLAGELLDKPDLRRAGRDALEALAEMFERRGLLSEYTSPTYTPWTLSRYADIADMTHDAEIARLAVRLEQRMWLDLATHFHAPTNILSGPHSRAYTTDSVGHFTQIHMVLYQAFGDRFWMTPPHYIFPPVEGQVVHHEGDAPFMQTSCVTFASVTYHPTKEIEKLTFDKTLPYTVVATAEYGAAVVPIMVRGDDPNGPFTKSDELFEYPSGETVTTAYLTYDYALGSGTAEFHDGNQTDTFYVNFRRAAPARSLRDVATIYSRYTTNDHRPGVPEGNPVHPEWGASTDLLVDEGRTRVAQKDGTALVLYQAKSQILDNVRSMGLTLVVTAFYGRPKRILVGDTELGQLPFESKEPAMIWIEDELVFAAFRPLILTNRGRSAAIRVEEQAGYLTFNLYNYQGEARRFTRTELCTTLNGFVAELGSRKEYGSFADFKAKVLAASITDEVVSNQRLTHYSRPGVSLEICHSPRYDGLKYVLIDGKLQDRPKFSAPGVSLGPNGES